MTTLLALVELAQQFDFSALAFFAPDTISWEPNTISWEPDTISWEPRRS